MKREVYGHLYLPSLDAMDITSPSALYTLVGSIPVAYSSPQ